MRWQWTSGRSMGLFPDTKNCGLCMRREYRERFPRHRLQRKPLVINPGMHTIPHNNLNWEYLPLLLIWFNAHKWPVTRKMFPFGDVIMIFLVCNYSSLSQLQRRFKITVVEVRAWMSTYIQTFYEDITTYPCPNPIAGLATIPCHKMGPSQETQSSRKLSRQQMPWDGSLDSLAEEQSNINVCTKNNHLVRQCCCKWISTCSQSVNIQV